MFHKILQRAKPYFINFSLDQVWRQSLSEIMKTRAFRNCLPSSKSYIKNQPKDMEFQLAFKKAPNPEIGMDLMKMLSPGMIPDSDILEFFSRAIACASVYMKTSFESMALEFEPPMGIKNRMALEKIDFAIDDDADELYRYFNENGLDSIGNDLHFHSAPAYLLIAAQAMTPDAETYGKLIVESGFNDLCKDYLSLGANLNSRSTSFNRSFIVYRLSEVFLMMRITECFAYATLSYKQGAFVDFRPHTKELERSRWDFFWKVALLDKWFPFTYPIDNEEFEARHNNGDYAND